MTAYLMELNVNKSNLFMGIVILNIITAMLNAVDGRVDVANSHIGFAIIFLCFLILDKK
jgi:hypothetical protein